MFSIFSQSCFLDFISLIYLDTGPERLSLCHCLSALGSHHGDMMPSLVPDLLATLVNVGDESESKSKKEIIVS